MSTPVIAAMRGHLELIRVLVEKLGADPDARETLQVTPLHIAARNGHHQMIRMLVSELDAAI